VLSDARKRRIYDQGGYDALNDQFDASSFSHADPFAMFNEFFSAFSDDPIFSSFGHGFPSAHSQQRRQNQQNPFGFGSSVFGNDPFMSPFGNMGNSSSMMFSSSSGGMGNMMSSSTTTQYIGGRKMTTKTTSRNGETIVEKYENDKLVQKMINGKEQDLQKLEYKPSSKDKDKNKTKKAEDQKEKGGDIAGDNKTPKEDSKDAN